MKSLCIKTNNKTYLNYLLNELRLSNINNIYFSQNQFENYKNIIIHYKGNNINAFYKKISNILSYLVIDEIEEIILKNIIKQNYFYFNISEQEKILNFCFDIFSDDFNMYFDKKFTYLSNAFLDYIQNNKTIILTGFITFRLPKYFDMLNNVIDEAVNCFIIEKEYLEFISLLKLYINSQKSNINTLHLIYSKDNALLLDETKTPISQSNDIFDTKFLSDITFSKNDYILNTILSLIPNKIYIHLIDNNIDEFINTLLLIFENKVEICTDCNICNLYKINNNLLKQEKTKGLK